MLKRKDEVVGQNTKGIEFLFRKNKITWAKGRGTLKAGNVVEVRGAPPENTVTTYQAKHVIIATGSVPIELPFLKFDEERVLSNVGALTIPKVPGHLIVIGGGVIGLELGSVWRRLGAKVTVVELLPAILPGMDDDVVKEADKTLRKQGLDIRTGTKVVNGGRTDDGVFVDVEKDGADRAHRGRPRPRLRRTPPRHRRHRRRKHSASTSASRGEILVDDQQRTNLPNVYAIGDCTPGPMLAHKAEEEGVVAAEVIAGKPVHTHHRTVPGVVYTWPEIAVVGLTERQAKESGRDDQGRQVPLLRQRPRAHRRARPPAS